jgi:hypothetical protein
MSLLIILMVVTGLWKVYSPLPGKTPRIVLAASAGREASDFNELTNALVAAGHRTVSVEAHTADSSAQNEFTVDFDGFAPGEALVLLPVLPLGLLRPRFAPLCQVRRSKKRLRAPPTLTPCFLKRRFPKACTSGAGGGVSVGSKGRLRFVRCAVRRTDSVTNNGSLDSIDLMALWASVAGSSPITNPQLRLCPRSGSSEARS